MIEIYLSEVRMQPRIKEGLQRWNPLEADGRFWRRISLG